MDLVTLPILAETTSLQDAVRAMKTQQRSAVLRAGPADLALVKITKIFKALGHNLTELSDVNVSEPVYPSTRAELSARNLDIKDPNTTWSGWDSFLNSAGVDYVMIDAFQGTALIVTRHEGLAGAIGESPSDCYCLGPDEHSIPQEATIVPVNSCSVCANSVLCA